MQTNRFIITGLMVGLLLLSGSMAAAQDDPGERIEGFRQWAVSATATSEYQDDSWSAMQATGAPDTETCADLPTAWASATATGQDSLTVMFAQPVYPTQVNIYQNYGPGAITGIEVIAANGQGDPIVIPKSADTGTECPGIFSFDFDENFTMNSPLINGIIINLDQSITGDWNEIDAVELVGNVFEVDLVADAGGSAPASGGDNRSSAPARDPNQPLGFEVTCDDGRSFTNGVEVVVVQMRSGFTYTATAIGIDGFDPVLAVLDESGRGLCADDDFNAAQYGASLPTTGIVNPSPLSSQVNFANNSRSAFADISLVVGGFENSGGEFILVLEGMALTSADGAGDPFSVQVTPGMVDSGVPLTAYMIAVTGRFDPLMALIDGDYNFVEDPEYGFVACDDAGNTSLCYGESYSLVGSYVSRSSNRELPGGQLDAMLNLPLEPQYEGGYYNFLMRSPNMQTFGDYIVAFHMGIAGN